MNKRTMGLLIGLAPLIGWTATGTDPVLGSWLLNASRSTLAEPAPKSEVRAYEVAPGGMKITTTEVKPDGTSTTESKTYQLDGKVYPVADSKEYDALAATQTDERTVDTDFKRGGKTVGHMRRMVSKDGKTLTLTLKLSTQDGKTINEVVVYDKQ